MKRVYTAPDPRMGPTGNFSLVTGRVTPRGKSHSAVIFRALSHRVLSERPITRSQHCGPEVGWTSARNEEQKESSLYLMRSVILSQWRECRMGVI